RAGPGISQMTTATSAQRRQMERFSGLLSVSAEWSRFNVRPFHSCRNIGLQGFSLPECPGTQSEGKCVPCKDETCPAGGLPGTLSIVQLVNSEVLVGMILHVVCIGVYEGNGIAIAEIDNDIATNLRDTV